MISTLKKIPALASQIYRSGQAAFAIRQLQRGNIQGKSLEENPGLVRLARAMKINPEQARDVWMGRLNTTVLAQNIVSAHKTLLGARYLARLSPQTHQQVRLMLGEVRRTHREAMKGDAVFCRKLSSEITRDSQQARQMTKNGRGNEAQDLRAMSWTNLSALSDLSDEMVVLGRGWSGNLVD